MTRPKRPATEISPIGKDSNKIQRRIPEKMTTEERINDAIADLNKKIAEIMGKEKPSNRDMIQMIALTSERDSFKYEYQLIPRIVASLLEDKLTMAMSDGGSLREAITYEVQTAMVDSGQKIEDIQKEIHSIKDELKITASARMPKKWGRILQNERIRCIESSSKGLVLFGQEIRPEENGAVNDEKLKDTVMEIVGNEEVIGWKRMAGRTALSKWNRDKPPTISIRLQTAAAREQVLKKIRTDKKFDVKREIPELLMEEFKELSEEARKLRNAEGCQTYVGFGGSDIFLRRRKDETDKWKTVKRL